MNVKLEMMMVMMMRRGRGRGRRGMKIAAVFTSSLERYLFQTVLNGYYFHKRRGSPGQ